LLIQLIVQRGAGVIAELPMGIRDSRETVAETIENNVRKLIIDESPINPKYYEKMSALLDALIAQRRTGVIEYGEYLANIAELTKQAANPGAGSEYPPALNTAATRALYDNLGRNEWLALAIDFAVQGSRQDEWRGNPMKVRKMKTKEGSCNVQERRIWLNLELAKKPEQCIEYIVVHELMHLLEGRHDERFVALMDVHLPNWRSLRDELNQAPLGHEEWRY
jgi:predicted metal-dependent hydrolase